MLDQPSILTAPGDEKTAARHDPRYDLVVIGAGVAGLNALYAAAAYLPKGARVLLIDQKAGAGGMWNTTYDYVRLHQPHPMFTVGDMKWDWRKPRGYLAARDEVRDHLASTIGAVSQKIDLDNRFGHTVTGCDEVRTDRGYRARVTFHPNGRPEETQTVEAARAIHAPGLNYREAEPLTLSSGAVISVIPQNLRAAMAASPGAPLYVIGGGKTGMDTVLTALAEDPGRKVFLINGRGTNFLNRTKYFPTGLKRWTSGALVSGLLRDVALHFDGENENDAIAHFRRQYASDPTGSNGVFFYGIQSEDEHARIVAGVTRIYDGYLADVSDSADGPVMTWRGGGAEPVEIGSIFVNCTGSIFRASGVAQEPPCLSPQDTVLSINARDGFHFLTSVAGFFLTHLLYRGALRGNGFYTLDHEKLFRLDRNGWVGASVSQGYMNQVIATRTLPLALLDRCGLDLDRWYPLPRRIAGLMRMKASAAGDIAHCRASLERVASRFGVHCAPLERV